MKKTALLFSAAAIATLFSCKKLDTATTSATSGIVSIDTTITAGSDYQLSLSSYGTNSSVNVRHRPTGAITSEVISTPGGKMYHYMNDANSGKTSDTVTLAVCTDSTRHRGQCPKHGTDSTVLSIRFKIVNQVN